MSKYDNVELYRSIYYGKKVIFEEKNLPLPYVHAGINFFAFSKTENSESCICSCQKESLSNAVELFYKYYQYSSADIITKSIRDFLGLPLSISKKICVPTEYNINKTLENINFKDHICHLCNSITPTTQHSICIYESKLNQQYGHYINSHFFTYGISNHIPKHYGIYFLPEKMPEDFKRILMPNAEEIFVDLINCYELSKYEQDKLKKTLDFLSSLSQEERESILYWRKINDNKRLISYRLEEELGLNDNDNIGYIQNSIHKRFLSVKKIIVDEIKKSFKLKRWVNESVLANIIQELFKGYTIYRNYRPNILEGLELDIYIQELKLGIEYQGIQHIKSVKQWGGEKDLKIRQEHDKRKAELCKKNDIKLIYFWYDEDVNKELVLSKLAKYLV